MFRDNASAFRFLGFGVGGLFRRCKMRVGVGLGGSVFQIGISSVGVLAARIRLVVILSSVVC